MRGPGLLIDFLQPTSFTTTGALDVSGTSSTAAPATTCWSYNLVDVRCDCESQRTLIKNPSTRLYLRNRELYT